MYAFYDHVTHIAQRVGYQRVSIAHEEAAVRPLCTSRDFGVVLVDLDGTPAQYEQTIRVVRSLRHAGKRIFTTSHNGDRGKAAIEAGADDFATFSWQDLNIWSFLEQRLHMWRELSSTSGLLLCWPPVEPLAQDNAEKFSELLDDVEQHVLHVVSEFCVQLCELVAKSSDALHHLEWRQVEQLIATALDGMGFDVILTPPSKDGGNDVVANCYLKGRKLTYFVEVKHWRSGKRPSPRMVFDFVEVNVSEQTDGGLFLSTSGYTSEVYSHLSEIGRKRIWLGENSKIVSLCRHFVRRKRGVWLPDHDLPAILAEGTVPHAAAAPLQQDGAPSGICPVVTRPALQ